MKKQLASILALSVIMSNSIPAINVFANEVIKEKATTIEREVNNKLRVGEFTLAKHPSFAKYDEQFKVGVTSITGNGGENGASVRTNAIDGKLDTFWESKNSNSANLKNELVLGFDEATDVNRLVYTVRQDASIGKGFPKTAQIYVSNEDEGENFELAGEVSGTAVNHKTVEYKFDTVNAKRIKFVFVEVERQWASAAEVWVYREDKVMDTMANLFTNDKMNVINPEYATKDKLNELEESAMKHPFYNDYKEDIANAKAILDGVKLTSTTAKVDKLVGYKAEGEEAYKKEFMIPSTKISNVHCNGGTWGSHKVENMFDNDPSTMWESNTSNSDKYKNELTFTFDETVELDRIALLARDIRVGFPEEFEIYASTTSKGDTFQKISEGTAKETNDFLQFRFEPTKLKRIKFKFNKIKGDRVYVAEARFYKEDKFSEKMETLFANDDLTAVNEIYAEEGALAKLEQEAMQHPLYSTFKEDLDNAKALLAQGKIEPIETTTKKVDYVNNTEYVKQYGISSEKIKGISTNGGQYGSQRIQNAIDGDQKTYWETNRSSNANWKHEVTVDFNEDVTLDRIAFGARTTDRKGFINDFEIYASTTTRGDNFQLVGTARGNMTTGLVESKFEPTKFRRLKIKVLKSHENWATINEIMFFQQDEIYNKMNRLFADATMSAVSDEFAKEGALANLETEAKKHPLYNDFREDLDNAKALLSQGKIEAVDAKTKKINYVDNAEYMSQYAIPREAIKTISNNGGAYGGNGIDRAIDGNLDTYWETGKGNSSEWKNEVTVEFKEPTTLNRLAYGARKSDRKGFLNEFEVYGSTTSKGDTFQKVANAKMNTTTGMVEAKFGNQTFKRIKLKAIKSDQNWASLNELMFFTEDATAEKMERLFTDEHLNVVSDEFQNPEAFKALEEEAKKHPLYNEFREDLDNAKLVLNPQEIKEGKAVTRVTNYLDNKDYMDTFNVPYTEVSRVSNNGGQYTSQKIQHIVDGDEKTYWETNTYNKDNWKNEVVVEFKETQTLDRIAYSARQSDGKGFIEGFEVYASETTKGDTFHKVATGRADYNKKLVEAKFAPTKFKRLKLVAVKANQNWPTINEMMFFKQDSVADRVNDLFTDSLMNELKPEYAKKEVIDALAKEVATHPLKDELQERIDRAREVLASPESFKSSVFELERRGDALRESQRRKMWNFRDWLPTGLAVKSGQKITVYVDVEPGEPVPGLIFKQMDVQNNGTMDIRLNPGKNEITVPTVTGTDYRPGIPHSGVLYATNPYNEEQQSRMPRIKIEGAFEYPHFVKGEDTNEAVMEQLREYEERRKADPDMPDVFDVFGDRTQVNVKSSYALNYFTKNGKTPSYSADINDKIHGEAMKFWGFDESSELNSDFNYRYVTMVKYLDKGGFMNAGNGITGVNQGEQGVALDCNTGWGLMHEMGHNMDTNSISVTEVTNNMLPLHFQMLEKIPARHSNRFDNELYPKLTKEDYSENEWYNPKDYTNLTHILPIWQLQMYDNTFWPRMQQYCRANNIGGGDWDNKHETWAIVASEVMQMDLTEFFQRHGFRPKQETIDRMAKFPKPDKKLWYSNDNMYLGERGAFKTEVSYTAKAKVNEDNVTLTYTVNKENRPAVLGYEILRDGKVIGFTKGTKFVDRTADLDKNHVYTIKAYDTNITPYDGVTVNSLQANLVSDVDVTIGLHEKFDPMDYVTALDSKGNKIENVKVTSDVNPDKVGDYTVKYEVDNGNGVVSSVMPVSVVSKWEYLSAKPWNSISVGWGTPYRNKDIKGRVNGEIRDFKQGIRYHAQGNVTYNLGDHIYDTLDLKLGVDMNQPDGAASNLFFKVIGDGEVLATSEVLTYKDDLVRLQVPIKGVKKLEIINDTNGRDDNDHGVIVEPRLVTRNARPEITVPENLSVKVGDTIKDLVGTYSATDIEDGNVTDNVQVTTPEIDYSRPGKYDVVYTVTDKDGNTSTTTRKIVVYDERDFKYVSDQNWKSAQTQHGTVNKDKATSGNALRLTDKNNQQVEYAKGIGTHAHSTIVYDLKDMNVDHFTSWIGVDRNQYGSPSTIEFQVLVDGEEVYKSGVMRSRDAQKFVSVNLTGAEELKLIVNNGGDTIGSDHADWADAKFYTINEDRVYATELVKLIEEAKKVNAEDYTEESIKALNDVIAKAEEFVKDENALTKETLASMMNELQGAIDSLVGADLTTPVDVPDAYLRKALAKVLKKDNGFTTGDMLKVTELSLSGVTNLEGLQHAKNLVSIESEYNEIKDLRPLAKLKNLEKANFKNQFVAVGELSVVDGNVTVNTEAYNRAGKNVATKVVLVDTDGNVLDEKVVDGATEVSLDVSSLEAGIYGVHVSFEDDELSGILMNIATIK